MKHSFRSLLITIGLIIGLGGAIAYLQKIQLNKIAQTTETFSAEVIERQVNDERIRLNILDAFPSFGFDNVIADWAFLSFLQYFGDKPKRELTGYQLSPEYFEVILDKDPYFLDAYLFLTTSTTLYTGQPERTIAILDDKLPQLTPKTPNRAYYIWRWKAVDELLFQGDVEAAQQSFLKASEWASAYDDDEARQVAENSRRTAEFLETNPDSVTIRISSWASIFYNTFDDNTRQRVIREIEALGAEASITPEGQLRILMPPTEEAESVPGSKL